MKIKFRIIIILLGLGLLTTLNSCYLVKTVPVPVDQWTLKVYTVERPAWTIEDASHKVRSIGNVTIHNDSIFGVLRPQTFVDHPSKKLYSLHRGPYSMSFIHLNAPDIQVPDIMAMPVHSIASATTHQKDYLVTGITTFVIATAITVTFIAVVCNCPYVNVIGADTAVFQGSLFPGAISKSLERTDNLIMSNVPRDENGNINVRISNELPEIEYFNLVELFEVKDMSHGSLGQHAKGHLVTYDLEDHLMNASTFKSDIKESVQSVDERFYDFKEQGNDYELNQAFFTFDKTNLGNNAMLIVRAKQSKWMETVGAFTIQQFGKAYDNWLEKLDKTDPARYNQNVADRGISMNAYVKRNERWELIGTYANAGTLDYRSLALNINLGEIPEEKVEIKLEAAHGFWDLDYVGMTDSWSEDVGLSKLEAISAINHAGENVMSALVADDGNRTELPNEGDFIDLHFAAPTRETPMFVLKGTGYYHHERNSSSKPNYKFLNAVRQDKMTTHQLSRLLESQMEIQAKQSGNR